ncbi:MAG: EAL domain-containing protein [Kineosporiaceae bacterium]
MTSVSLAPRRTGRRQVADGPWLLVLVGALVLVFAHLGATAFSREGMDAAVWWPAAGLGCAVVVRWPRRRAATLAVVTAATAVAATVDGALAWQCLALTVVAAVEAAVTVTVLVGPRAALARGPRTDSADEAVAVLAWHPRRGADVARLTCAVALAAASGGAVLAVAALLAGRDLASALELARATAAAHGTGMVVLLPALLAVEDKAAAQLRPGRSVEAAAQLLATGVVSGVVFLPGSHVALSFLPLLPLLWGATRLGVGRTTASLALATTVAALGWVNGGGPFGGHDPLTAQSLTQLLMVTNALVALALALTSDQRDRLTAELAHSEESFRRSFDRALLGMAVLELGQTPRVEHCNPSLVRMLERDPSGQPWTDVIEASDHAKALAAVGAVRDGHLTGWHGELRHLVDGQPRWFEVALAPLPGRPEGPVRASAQLVDVTERRQAEDRLRDLALHDALTGLPNRLLLMDRIGLALAGTRRSGNRAALLFCDLDDFKDINDSAGHAAGDAVLIEVAQRVVAAVRPTDTVARLGGDEFVVLCPEVPDQEVAESIASRIIAALTSPVDVEGASYRSGASIGLALSGPDSTADSLLQDADTAMYVAKRDGKRQLAVFAPEHHEVAVRAVRIAEEAAVAVEAGQLRLHYQPIVDLASGRVRSVEALLRWEHPTEGLLEPAQWLDVVAGGPLASEVGSWALAEALRQTGAWWRTAAADGQDGPGVHVNLFGRQLRSTGLADQVRALLHQHGLPGRALTLELHPAHLEAAPEEVLGGLIQLRRDGVRLSVDEFGSGIGSLAHLAALPVDQVKIDRRVVAGLEDARGLAVVQAVIGIGRTLNLDVIAVGVQTSMQRRRLEGLGCQRAQGFLWSRPVPADQVRWGVSTSGLVLPAMR